MEINISINGVKTDTQTVKDKTTADHGEISSDGGSSVAIQSNGYSHSEDENLTMVDIGAPPDWLLEGIKNSSTDRSANIHDGDIEDAGSGPED